MSERPNYPLARLQPSLMTLSLKAFLSKKAAEYVTLCDTIDKFLDKLVDGDAELEGKISKLFDISNELCIALGSRHTEGYRVNIGSTSSNLRTTLDSFSPTSERLDEVTCKKYYRRLAQKHHPDRGGDPEVFAVIKSAYEARAVELLFLYLVDVDTEALSDEVLRKMLGSMLTKLDTLRKMPSYEVASSLMAGSRPRARRLLSQFLDTRIRKYHGQLLGIQENIHVN